MYKLSYNSTRDLKIETFFLRISSLKLNPFEISESFLIYAPWNQREESGENWMMAIDLYFFFITRMPFLQKYLSIKSITLFIIHHLLGTRGYLYSSYNFSLSRFLSMVKLSALKGKILMIIYFLQLVTVNTLNAHYILANALECRCGLYIMNTFYSIYILFLSINANFWMKNFLMS